MELEKSQTWKNLESSLSQEAVAYCEYTFYGQQAAKDGYKQISDIFNETAGNELHHAKLHYKKMHGGKVPGTLDNLKAAAASEDEEVEIYTGYAKTAREEGFADLADFFEGLAAIEKSHENRYQLLIERIRKIQSELPPLESDVSEEEAAFTEAAEEQLAQTQAQRRYFYLRR